MPSAVTVIVASPIPIAFTSPVWSTVATDSLLLDQVTKGYVASLGIEADNKYISDSVIFTNIQTVTRFASLVICTVYVFFVIPSCAVTSMITSFISPGLSDTDLTVLLVAVFPSICIVAVLPAFIGVIRGMYFDKKFTRTL